MLILKGHLGINLPLSICASCARQLRGRSGLRQYRQKANSTSRTDYQKTLDWARKEFKSHLAPEIPDTSLQLGLLSLYIAIEDAAAAEVLHQSDPPLLEQAVFRFVREKGTANEKLSAYEQLGLSEMPVLGELGMPSTWNLGRLDSLAYEVEATLRNNLFDGTSPAALSEPFGEVLGGGQNSPAWNCHEYAKAYPMLAIAAVNEVLFTQHGYQGQPAKKDPRQYQLPFVMELGGGAPAVLTILYMEVCSRIGLPLQVAVLEQGHYAVLWPRQEPMLLAGQEVVIDVYSEGALFLVSEVRQLFDLGPGPLPVASNRELLCALLSGLRDLHWCKAVGCRTERALTIPLTLKTALSGAVTSRRGYQIERAIAAAERCCWVSPNNRDHKISLALLLYYGGRRSDAMRVIADDHSMELQHFKDVLRLHAAYQDK